MRDSAKGPRYSRAFGPRDAEHGIDPKLTLRLARAAVEEIAPPLSRIAFRNGRDLPGCVASYCEIWARSPIGFVGLMDFWPNDASVFCTSGQMTAPVPNPVQLDGWDLKHLRAARGQTMLPNAARRWFKSQEAGRIPVSMTNELVERNPFGGTDKAERRRTQGAARRHAVKRSVARSRSAAKEATMMMATAYGFPWDVLIQEP